MNRWSFSILCLLTVLSITANAAAIQLPRTGQTTSYAAADDGDTKGGKPWPVPRFIDNYNETITDNLTGLIWTRNGNPMKSRDPGTDTDGTGGDGAVSWQHALDYIKKLNTEHFLGYNYWRLPNLNELASLVNQGKPGTAPWLNEQGFIDSQPIRYWSSSTNVMSTGTAWTVFMADGTLNYFEKAGLGNAWPVRGGQSGAAVSSGIDLPKTGQFACFDTNGVNISCAGTGQDGELQMGAAWPQPRFSDNGDQTVTDNLTGLIWIRDANLMIIRDPSFDVDGTNYNGAVTWQGALDYVRKLNQESYLGFSDWRLPNRNELASLVNYVEADPFAWLNWQGFFSVQGKYWTSGTVASVIGNAWNVYTTGVILGENKSASGGGSFVWPVRGGAANTDPTQAVAAAAVALSVSTSALADGYKATTYTQTLAATGGKTPYTWSKSSGTLPAGLTLSSAGVISGKPTATGSSSFTVQVKDANNTKATKTLKITVYATLSVTTASLPAGTVGTTYSQTMVAGGGKTPYSWSVTSGTLPARLAISSAGVISGTPTTAGSSTFTVQVADANSVKATKSMTIIINAALTITTTTFPDGYVGTKYSQTLAATGGKTPYTWSRTAGSVPAGLSLSSAGIISGTPTTAGSTNFTVQVKDGNNATSITTLTITIVPAVSVASTTLLSGTVGSAYNQTLAASGGKMPYTWSITSGTLPAGLSLNGATGAITGTPTEAVSTSFTAQVNDANNKTASGDIDVTINLPVSITTSTLHDSFIGMSYSSTLTATGGLPPYTWAISGGSLPAGLSLNTSTGAISGTPTAVGGSSFTIQVQDASNSPVSKSFTVKITNFGSISGIVTDQATSAPLSGVNVTLNLSGITSIDPNDRVYTCNDNPLSATDYDAVAENDGIKLSCSQGNLNIMLFKVRNPYGKDPFSFRWNGISASGGEYLAQSFKPSISGNLNEVSFYLPNKPVLNGTLYVQLKSALGGDAGTHLAQSNNILISAIPDAGWVDFTFPTPVSVTAGQEYYLEIQGSVLYGLYLADISWASGAIYANGSMYARSAGLWAKESKSLAFRTYTDNQLDVVIDPSADNTTYSMNGDGSSQQINVEMYNHVAGGWQLGGDVVYSGIGTHYIMSYGSIKYNGDDLTIEWPVSDGLDRYYDQNGWLMVKVDNHNWDWMYPPGSNLLTDQFSLTFNRTLTTTTDINGAYSFSNLPDGIYSITYEKPAYGVQTANGALTPGQTVNIGQSMFKAPLASLQGIVSYYGGALAGITVTVTDPMGSESAVTDSQGNYLISGIVYGNYTVTFAGPELISKTLTGSLSPGQAGVMNVTMSPAAISFNIASPTDGSVVYTNPLTVTGSALNADSVTVTINNNGTVTNYPATIVNGTYSVSILLAAGQTWISVNAKNKYNINAGQSISITLAPFTLRSLGDTGNVAVMEVTGNFDAKKADGSYNDQPRKAIAKEYFKTHGDLDFLVMLSTFDYIMPETGAQGFYLPVKNDTQGINQAITDNTAQFGSAGMLQGTIDLGNVTALAAWPYGPKLDQTVMIMNHEIGHRWGSYVRFKNPDGTLNTALLGKDSAHWSYLLDSKGSVMYGNGWKDNGNGTFTSIAKQSGYSPLDLYLMGMIPKEQVPPMLLIDNPAIDKTQLPQLGATITGTAKTVTIDDIIAAEGARAPDAASSQKKFNIGFVLLTRPGDNAATAAQAIETVRTAFAGRFAELTQGTGGVNGVAPFVTVVVDSPSEGATVTGPDVTVTGTVINSTGAETGVVVNGIPAAVSGSRFIVNHVPLQTGANSLTITATDANGLTASATRSVTAAAGNYIRITSNIESGIAPLDISLRLDGSFNIANPTVTFSGPVPVTLTQGTASSEYTATLTVEGTYTFTASAVGPDGQTYRDTFTVTVISRQALETLLKGKWEGIKSKISGKDVEGAVAYFISPLQQDFREAFTAAGASLSLLSNYLNPIELVYVSDSLAKCRMMRNEEVSGQLQQIEYVVYYIKENGIWKLRDF